MTQQTLLYDLDKPLPCGTCGEGADVILCTKAGIAKDNLHHIDASFTKSPLVGQKNCQTVYRYTFFYDDADLEGSLPLKAEDITGIVCRGCWSQYVDDVADTPFSHSDSLTYNTANTEVIHESVSSIVTSFFLRSADSNNLIGIGSDGYPTLTCTSIQACQIANSVIDTNTIDFSATGTLNRIISGNVKVSAVNGNKVQVASDGIYVLSTGTPGTGINVLGLAGNAGPVQTLEDADVITILGDGVMYAEASATDTITIYLQPGAENEVLSVVSGVPTWVAPPGVFRFYLQGDSGTVHQINNNDEVQIDGEGVIATEGVDIDRIVIRITPGEEGDVLSTVDGEAVWVASAGTYEFVVAGNSGIPQTINSGNTLSVIGSGLLTTVANNIDQLVISLNGGSNGEVLSMVGGSPAWAAPANVAFTVAGNSGTPQSITNGNTLSILGTGLLNVNAVATDTLNIGLAAGSNGQVLATADGTPAWTTQPTIASGIYTPNVLATTNVDTTNVYPAQWMRVGDTVTVSGKIDIDTVLASTETRVTLSLPVASDIQNDYEVAGTAYAYVIDSTAAITGGVVSNGAFFRWFTGASVTNNGWFYSYTYRVI